MSLNNIRVRDFQSIEDVEILLGNFTVLVGPSNSGKSAFLRGVRACVRNSFVPANVRQGASKSIIDLDFTDESNVTIERGKSLSTYKLDNGKDVFTKSARGVPDDVAKVLRFPLIGGEEASFVFQFDKPFLLADSGSTVAQVLGSLTNVSLLHSAVREANRRRQESASTLKVRTQDVEKFKAQIENFRDLPTRKKTLDRASKLLTEALAVEGELGALSSAKYAVEVAQGALQALKAVQPPDVEPLIMDAETLNEKLSEVSRWIIQVKESIDSLKVLIVESKSLKKQIKQAEEAYHDRLVQLGQCPTCGQTVN